jgi:TM2 domain-containing membrane protein YozV
MTKNCRKCLTAFDSDLSVCPVCKTAIIQAKQEKGQVTETYFALRDQLELVQLKSRIVATIMTLIFGILGAGFLYLGKIKQASIMVSSFVLSLLTTLILFPTFFPFVLIGYGLIQITLGLSILLNPDCRDGRGELLK